MSLINCYKISSLIQKLIMVWIRLLCCKNKFEIFDVLHCIIGLFIECNQFNFPNNSDNSSFIRIFFIRFLYSDRGRNSDKQNSKLKQSFGEFLIWLKNIKEKITCANWYKFCIFFTLNSDKLHKLGNKWLNTEGNENFILKIKCPFF